jgi:hypothetical protein
MSEPIFGYNGYNKIDGTRQFLNCGLPNQLMWLVLGDPCWYCNEDLIHHVSINRNKENQDLKQNMVICGQCGWWMIIESELFTKDNHFPRSNTYFSKLLSFETLDKEIELDILSSALARKWKSIDLIHPKKFEELIADIIKDKYSCEVKLTGYSKDNGIDFYSVICDQPWAFQVKRRASNSVEGIEGIREFIGSMVQNNAPNGVYVTSAYRYTKGALGLSQNQNLSHYRLKLDLLNGSDIKKFFNLYYTSKISLWEKFYLGSSEEIFESIKSYRREK